VKSLAGALARASWGFSALGVDVTTVEWHLSRATRKLGVRSRSDLAAVIARGSAGPVGEERE
jgi:DNA-binding CsgD family transcriptional regulator